MSLQAPAECGGCSVCQTPAGSLWDWLCPGVWSSTSPLPRGTDSHPPPTLWNHIILMRMQMRGERVGNGTSWVACQKGFPGEGWLSPAPSSAAAFAGGLALGGTWPSLKETHLHWCPHCCMFLFTVFKQLMQVLTALPFWNFCEPFILGICLKTHGPGDRGQACVWHTWSAPLILVQVSVGLEHLSQGDRRESWGSGLVCWAPKLLFREGDRERTGIERDSPGDLCTDNSHYVSKWFPALCGLGLLFSL